jgi:HK97 family phage major capsid protein
MEVRMHLDTLSSGSLPPGSPFQTISQRLQLETEKIQLAMKARIEAAKTDEAGWTKEREDAHAADLKSLDALERRITRAAADEDMMRTLEGHPGFAPAVQRAVGVRGKSLGATVVTSADFKAFLDYAKKSSRFDSPNFEVKAALLSDGLVPPDVAPIVPGPTRRLLVGALFAQTTTISNAVTYNRETAFTNNAGAVAEAQPKPESDVTLTPIVEPVRKYAHFITASKEALEDIPQIQGYIDGRLRYGLALKIDDALVNGSTTPPSLVGVLNRTGLSAAVTQGAGESAADAILRQVAAVTVASGLLPDALVVNPADWAAIIAGKNTAGDYYGPGPFTPPGPPTLWGLNVAVSQSIAAKTVLVGSFKQGAALAWRETITISVSNSHSDYFVRNLVAILAEARLALLVTMPEAFGKVTLVTTP